MHIDCPMCSQLALIRTGPRSSDPKKPSVEARTAAFLPSRDSVPALRISLCHERSEGGAFGAVLPVEERVRRLRLRPRGAWTTAAGTHRCRTRRHSLSAEAIRARATSRCETWPSTNRAWTRSNAASGSSSAPTSWRRTSKLASWRSSRNRVSISVASTCPSGPTRSASQHAIEPPPAPTSRQRQPLLRPHSARCRIVPASYAVARPAKRFGVGWPALSKI
jgi:hypothetical protein